MNCKILALGIGLTAGLSAAPGRANVAFNLIAEPGTPQNAIDGFVAAGNLWSSLLADDITVNIQIGFTSLGPGVLGEAGSAFIETSYTQIVQALFDRRTSADDVSSHAALQSGSSYYRLINHTSDSPWGPNSATPYVDSMDRVGLTTANAKALGLLGPREDVDGLIRFSSDFPFDFNHGEIITPGHYDFIGVAAHEIGHLLGFVSGVDDIDFYDGIFTGDSFSSNLIDLFRFSPLSLQWGVAYSDYTADTRDKYFSVNGGVTLLDPFATGVNYGDGMQPSHWKDSLGIGLMDPAVGTGERLNISPSDLRALDVLGYTVIPEPSTQALLVCGFVGLLMLRWRRRETSTR